MGLFFGASAAKLRRYALGLAARSALRFFAALKNSVWPDGHPAASLGRSSFGFQASRFASALWGERSRRFSLQNELLWLNISPKKN